ncbi:Hsp70 family protein [Kitasatospora purpeofusca]|uniref:Hsp70 family protein n=1 Tax=Kitasatospora purpeofusca TaxID=67352 RepID=UPI003868BC78
MKKQRVIVAVDFGTHGTGFAWTTIDDLHKDPKRRQIWVRTRWKDHPSPYPKNLSALLLDENDEIIAWGYEARRRWAMLSAQGKPEGCRYVSSFKMSLAPDPERSTGEISGGTLKPEESRTLATLILKSISSLAVEEVQKSGFSADEIRWCLTVPAIWDDYQKQLMKEAAVAAGLPDDPRRMQLVLEPEAAAYHARVSTVRTVHASGGRASLLSRGSRFLVADCGGGTVDLTAYRTDNTNKLVEIGREYGGKYGSEYVNQAFLESILTRRFGSYSAIDKINSAAPASLLELMDSWEKAKAVFDGQGDDDIYLQLPAAIDRLLDEESRNSLREQQAGVIDFIVVKAAEAREVFEVVVPKILSLVDKQLAEMKSQRRNAPGRELVILVGGFGNSPYLQKRLESHLAGRADILVPPEPEVAVLRGAVHYLYDPQTKSRRTKYTYGCNSALPFNPGRDPEGSKFISYDGRELCEARFKRFVHAGQSVRADEVVEHSFLPLQPNQESVRFDLFVTNAVYPRYVTDDGCRKVGEMTIDLSEVMSLPLDERSVNLQMLFGEVQIRVTATVAKTGQSTTVDLDFMPA